MSGLRRSLPGVLHRVDSTVQHTQTQGQDTIRQAGREKYSLNWGCRREMRNSSIFFSLSPLTSSRQSVVKQAASESKSKSRQVESRQADR